MSSDELQAIVFHTIAVMTTIPDRHAEWREVITKALQDTQQRGTGWHFEVEFFNAVRRYP